jgi:hypothetical protein
MALRRGEYRAMIHVPSLSKVAASHTNLERRAVLGQTITGLKSA